MSKHAAIAFAFAILQVASTLHGEPQQRDWYNVSRAKKTRGKIVSADKTSVHLVAPSGAKHVIPLDQLSKGDRRFVEGYLLFREARASQQHCPFHSGRSAFLSLHKAVIEVDRKKYRVVDARISKKHVGVEALVLLPLSIEEEINKQIASTKTESRVNGQLRSVSELGKQRLTKIHDHYKTLSAAKLKRVKVVSTVEHDASNLSPFPRRRPATNKTYDLAASSSPGLLVYDKYHDVLTSVHAARASELIARARDAATYSLQLARDNQVEHSRLLHLARMKKQRASANVYLARGDAFVEKKTYAAAIEAYRKAGEIAPEEADVYLRLGRVYFAQSDRSQSMRELSTGIRKAKAQRKIGYRVDDVEAACYHERSCVEFANDEFEAATSDAEHANAIVSSTKHSDQLHRCSMAAAGHLASLAEERLKNKDFDSAVRLANSASSYNTVATNEKYDKLRSRCYFSRGKSAHSARKYVAAAKDFRIGCEADPAHALCWFYLGQSQYLSDDFEAATLAFTTGMRLKDDAEWHLYYRGLSYKELHRYRSAKADFQQALSLKSNFKDAHYQLGYCHWQLKEYAETMTSMERATRQNLDHAEAYYYGGLASQSLKNYAAATSKFSSAIKRRKSFGEAYLGRGECQLQLNNYATATADLQTAARLLPTNSHAKTLLATASSRHKNQVKVSAEKAKQRTVAFVNRSNRKTRVVVTSINNDVGEKITYKKHYDVSPGRTVTTTIKTSRVSYEFHTNDSALASSWYTTTAQSASAGKTANISITDDSLPLKITAVTAGHDQGYSEYKIPEREEFDGKIDRKGRVTGTVTKSGGGTGFQANNYATAYVAVTNASSRSAKINVVIEVTFRRHFFKPGPRRFSKVVTIAKSSKQKIAIPVNAAGAVVKSNGYPVESFRIVSIKSS